MIARTQATIQLKEGVTVKLLLTPALYGIAKERGIDIFSDILRAKVAEGEGTEDRATKTVDAYSKIVYCAAILAWEVDAVDNPDAGEFPYTYADFYTWAWGNHREFARTIQAVLVALTGRTINDYLKEADGGDAEKKKTNPKGLAKWLRRIGRQSRRSS
jgi:hypothetical protein